MKTHILTGMAGLALIAGTSIAHAQTYNQQTYGKGDARIINDAERIEPQAERRTQTTTVREERVTMQQQPVYDVQPAAGNDNPYDDFTGFYAGGDIGYAIGSAEIDPAVGAGGDVGMDGMNAGVFIGYGFEHSFNWLGAYAGLEAAYEWSGADGDFGGTTYEKDEAWLITARPGISMYEDALAYGIVGYSLATFEGGGGEEELDGLVLGAGAQFDTKSPLKPRIEYTYTNYGDETLGGTSIDPHENNIKLGAVLQF